MLDGIDITQAFEKVMTTLNALCLHVHDELRDYPVWIDSGTGELVTDRDKVIYVLKQLTLMEGISPQETFACVGAVGCNAATFSLIEAVNQAKDAFREVVNHYMAMSENKDTAIIRRLLALSGYPGIKLKQVFRHIRTIDFHPRRISFIQGRHNSHRVISRSQAEHMLKSKGQGLHIDIQLAKLSLLAPDARLVIHRDIQSHCLANISTFKGANGRSRSTKLPSSLPIFYLHEDGQPLPSVNFGKKTNRHKLSPRSDKQIEEQPFLPSINAFRYK